jgi:hypothetical protein
MAASLDWYHNRTSGTIRRFEWRRILGANFVLALPKIADDGKRDSTVASAAGEISAPVVLRILHRGIDGRGRLISFAKMKMGTSTKSSHRTMFMRFNLSNMAATLGPLFIV